AGDDLGGIINNARNAFTVGKAAGFTDIEVGLKNEEITALDHNTGNLVVSAFNNGTIGANKFNDTNYGSGISWKGYNGLWRSGPVFGSSAYSFVNGQSHNYNPSFFDLVNVASDFATGLTSEIVGDVTFDQTSLAVISDSNAANPFKLDIIQKVYSKTGEDVVFYRYGFVNDNPTPIPGTSAGVFVDYDVEAGSYDYTQNQGGLSLGQHLAYQYTDVNGPYFGVVALNGLDGGIVTANDVATAEELRTTVWDYITNITDTASGVGDQRTWIGTEIGTIEAGDTAWVTFAFVAGDDLTGIINNARNAFTIGNAAGFTDIDVSLKKEGLMTLDHNTGNIVVSAFNNGTIGANKFDGTNFGSGIEWKGTNGLWRSGPVFGTTWSGTVNGQSHNYNPSFLDLVNVVSDFASGLTSEIVGDITFDQTSLAIISDSAAANPTNLDIIQKVYSKTGEDAVFYRYGYVNNTDSAISGFSGGVFVDYDVETSSTDYLNNQGGFVVDTHLAYQFADATGGYYGVVAINGLDGGTITSTDVGTEEELRTAAWGYISSLDQTDPGIGDQRTWIGTEVGTIEVGDTAWVTFAFVAGDDLAGITKNAKNAFVIAEAAGFTEIEVGVEKNDSGLPIRFELSQNYPNPFNPSTTIKYSIPANNTNAVQTTKIVVYDILGKEVQTIVNEKQSAGHYEVSFDAGNLSSGVYFYRIQHGEFVSSKKMMLLK
ncbi:MAG: T9SS type A sorting domain-containing protein, partial [Bacteroidota bacterium]